MINMEVLDEPNNPYWKVDYFLVVEGTRQVFDDQEMDAIDMTPLDGDWFSEPWQRFAKYGGAL